MNIGCLLGSHHSLAINIIIYLNFLHWLQLGNPHLRIQKMLIQRKNQPWQTTKDKTLLMREQKRLQNMF